MEWLLETDKAIFLFINARLIHPVLDVLMPLFTNFGTWAVPGILAAGLFVYKEKKKALIVLGLIVVTFAICDSTSNIIKKLALRPRPCHPDFLVEGGRFLLGMRKSLASFPSSHTSNMFSIATLLYCFYPRRWLYFFAFAAMIGYTRVYCGVHYPLDVLAGAIFGIMVGGGVYIAYLRIRDKVNNRKKKRPINPVPEFKPISKPITKPDPIPLSTSEEL